MFFHKTISFLQMILILADFCFLTSIQKVPRMLKNKTYECSISRKVNIWVLVLLCFPTDQFSILFCPLWRSKILIFNATFHFCFPLTLFNRRYHWDITRRKEEHLVLISPNLFTGHVFTVVVSLYL